MARNLTRDLVLRQAVALADAGGIEALSMRKLARELGVEAMSLYHHVSDKNDLLDGMVDLVVGEFERPGPGDDWRTAMRARCRSVREVLGRHPWAVGLLDSRTNAGDGTIGHHDAVLGCLRTAGFSLALAGHAFAVLDAYVFGFALQDRNLPFETPEELEAIATAMLERFPAERYPHFAEFSVEHVLQPGYDFAAEFDFGLELVLDGLERARHDDSASR